MIIFKLISGVVYQTISKIRVPRADSRARCHAYGLALKEQNEILDQMTELMRNVRAVGKKNMLPFQKGIIQSNNALRGLFAELNARYGAKFILTYRLNQDVLENFFGVIRAKGGLHDHPDQQEFKFRLRSYLLGRNEGVLSTGANVEYDDTPDFERKPQSLTGGVASKIYPRDGVNEEPVEQKELKDIEYDGLENLAGYICHKLEDEVPDISIPRSPTERHGFTWVDHLNEGGLCKPTENMMTHMEALHSIFQKIEEAASVDCSEKIKKLFFRASMFFKIRNLNREIVQLVHNRKRRWAKTLN